MSRGKQEKETEEEGGKRGTRNRGDTRGTIERRNRVKLKKDY